MTLPQNTNIESAVFRRLIQHLQDNKNVQNIDLMILADFCRNCLSKWYVAESEKQGTPVTLEDAHQVIYGMSYADWKKNHQPEATPEQLQAFTEKQKRKQNA